MLGREGWRAALVPVLSDDIWHSLLISYFLTTLMILVLVWIAVDLAHKFGLTAEQFGENLRDQYQRHDVEQDPAEPLEIAEQYIAKYVSLFV